MKVLLFTHKTRLNEKDVVYLPFWLFAFLPGVKVLDIWSQDQIMLFTHKTRLKWMYCDLLTKHD